MKIVKISIQTNTLEFPIVFLLAVLSLKAMILMLDFVWLSGA